MEKPHMTRHRSLFPPGSAIHFDVDLEPRPFSLSYLADSVLSGFLPRSVLQELEITGLKGRGAWTSTSDHRCPAPEEPEDELLYLEGRIIGAGEELNERSEDLQAAEIFSLRLKTVFKQFVGAKDITHRIIIEKRGSLFETVGIEELGRAIPLEISRVRLGVDIFEAAFAGSYFGFAPVVRKSFLIDGDRQKFRVELDVEGVKDRRSHLFTLHPLLAEIPPLVALITGKDLDRIVSQAKAQG